MGWIKQGRIFHLEDSPNRSNHVQVPTPFVMGDRVRVYYSCRNNGKSFVAYFDLEKDLKTILKVHEHPIMKLGKPGMFDSDGVMPSCVMRHRDEIWMYYIGWNSRSEGARYHNEIGLAISRDGGELFERKYEGPIIGRTRSEPGLAVMPFVLFKNWYRMWYQSLVSWEFIDGQYEPVYVLKYAESTGADRWTRYSEQCIRSSFPLEAFSRPSVVFDNDVYKMWFCHRSSSNYRGGNGSYRIGYAESIDGKTFERHQGGLDVGENGEWDSDMVCYPYVVDIEGKRVMFYNGNGFGQTGIGLAIYEN